MDPPLDHHIASSVANADGPGIWRVVSAVVRGPNHERKGSDCDDACQYRIEHDWLVAVICDGAGGAAAGGRGAKLASTLTAELLINRVSRRSPLVPLRKLLISTLVQVHSELSAAAKLDELSLPDLSTTIVGAVFRGRRGLFFHIGDGFAVAFSGDGTVVGRSDGTPKTYANEPCFLNDPAWETHLVISTASSITEVMLMTDGVSPFAVRRDSLNQAFISHVRARARRGTEAEGSAAIEAMLDHPRAREEVGDDKTLLWAGWVGRAEKG